MDRPEIIDDPDLEELKDALEEFMDGECEAGSEHSDCDCEHYLFERLMQAFYGEDVYEYLNDRFYD